MFSLLCLSAFAQAPPQLQTPAPEAPAPQSKIANPRTYDLYHQLGNLGLDPQAVYKVREASFDREDIHFSLTDGTIGFTYAINGEITGALFVGEGEVLIVPPDQTERHSLAMFTKSAVLSEHFNVAYFRFYDPQLIADLNPALRAPEKPEEFIKNYSSLAKSLSEPTALRTFIALTRDNKPTDKAGRFLLARISGIQLGSFDLVFDPNQREQISVSQATYTDRGRFYDLWMSFPMRSIRQKIEETKGPGFIGTVDITRFKARVDVRPPTDLSAEAELNFDVLQSGDRTLAFELSRYLKLSAVLLEAPGAPAVNLDYIQNQAIEGSQLARQGNDIVAVVFPQPLVQGQKINLKFVYSGAVMSDAGGGMLYVGARGTWYPNRGPAMAWFELEFHYPSAWRLIATGKLVSHKTTGNTETSLFVSEAPMPLAGFNLGQYVSNATQVGATKIETFSARGMEASFQTRQAAVAEATAGTRARPTGRNVEPPPLLLPDPTRNAQKVLAEAARTIEFLSPKIGPFPFSSLSLTQMPGLSSQGWPGLVFLSSYVFLSPEDRAQSRLAGGSEGIEILYAHVMTPHETAHQWWGDAVFWNSYRDQWIMEALANYCALLRLETEDPAQLKKFMDYYRLDLLSKPMVGEGDAFKDAGPVSLGIRLNSSKYAGAYDPVVYGRGTWLMHMLRHMLKDSIATAATRASRLAKTKPVLTQSDDPDALFYSVLRNLQTKYKGKSLSTRELQTEFEAVLPPALNFENRRSLDWFFDGWVNGIAIPRISLDNVKLSQTGTRHKATGVIRQKNAPETMVTSVPIYASFADGTLVYVARVFADGAQTEFTVNVPAGTRRLVLDPYQTVLTEP